MGPLSYLVRLPNGDMWRRHIDHLLPGSENSLPEPDGDYSQTAPDSECPDDDVSPSEPPGRVDVMH